MQKVGIPEELGIQLSRLVQQNQIVIAGTLLNVYFKRFWKIDDVLASQYVIRYFRKYHEAQLDRYLTNNK
jgi:hypothetical protein